MKKYFLFLLFLMIASLGLCQPAGALKGYYPASGTYHLLTVATPSADIPAWPFNYPTGTALGYYPASSTYHPLIVDELGRLAVDAGAQGLWEDVNGNVVPVGSAPVVVDKLTIKDQIECKTDGTKAAIVVPQSSSSAVNTGIKLSVTDTGIFATSDRICIRLAGTNLLSMRYSQGIDSASNIFAPTFKQKNGSFSLPGFSSYTDTNTGLHFLGGDVFAFVTGGIEAARFTDGQRLLLGTTEDDGVNTLQVNGTGRFIGQVLTADYTEIRNGNTEQWITRGFNASSLANDATQSVANYTVGDKDSGVINIVDRTENQHAEFYFHGTTVDSPRENPDSDFSNTQGTAGSINVYITGGAITVENKDGAARAIKIFVQGFDE